MVKTIEGWYKSGREFAEYQEAFGIDDPHQLSGRWILNLGCGYSDLSGDLAQRGIEARVVDVDRFNTEILTWEDRLALFLDNLINRKKNPERKISLEGRRGRTNFSLSDMAYLPFPDRSFDEVFALYSTYQLPKDKRFRAFSEALRACRHNAYFGPIVREDFDYLVAQVYNDSSLKIRYCLASDKYYDWPFPQAIDPPKLKDFSKIFGWRQFVSGCNITGANVIALERQT